MNQIYVAGNSGPKVKSDCRITLETKSSGGISISINSKVQKFFETHHKKLINDALEKFKMNHCNLILEDAGALDYVLLARLETVLKNATELDISLLPESNGNRTVTIFPDTFRRSRLYLPGNNPKFFINAGLYQSDGIIFDLEDSVAPEKKEEARVLVRNGIIAGDYNNAEIMVRINQLPLGLTDLEYVIPYGVDTILIPKCESAENIQSIEEKIKEIRKNNKIDKPVYLMPIIESALGVIKSFEIASASENVVALTIGLEDYTADLGVERTRDGKESEFARNMLVNAAKAAGIQAIDSVVSDVEDMEALYETARAAKKMGFNGMGCIHPRQIEVIHRAFAPTETEIEKAKKIILAFNKAKAEGKSVVALNSKMIDPPVVIRAQTTIKMAMRNNLLEEDWEEKENE